LIVVALGGNAVAPPGERPTIANQFRHTRASLASVVELARAGWRIALVHGNGPQVGDELARQEIASGQVEPLPLGVLVAGTAGWMGYMIQQSLQNALARAGIARAAVTLVTQTLCDRDDPAMRAPTKPIGHDRWRRLAPSPRPRAIVEAQLVQQLVQAGSIVIACGGGGPPVYRDPQLGLEGIEAVVDKDRTAAVLARTIGADTLLILTNVDAVYRDFGTPRQQPIRRLSLADADALLAGEALGQGSMRPKVEAAAEFVREGGTRAVIAELADGSDALAGRTGTTISRDAA
jgi:carbamate kinase